MGEVLIAGFAPPSPAPTPTPTPQVFVPVTNAPLPLPHLALPLALGGDGTFAAVQQDTLSEVAQSVEVICGSLKGSRTVVPAFGLPLEAFISPNPNLANMQKIIAQWDPRAATSLSVVNTPPATAQVQILVDLANGESL